jgi:phenylacetic acid degradation operon negative regulatory protein
MAAGRLVDWCALFGVAEGTARVALSRMVDRGELAAVDGIYELSGHLRGRQPSQDWSLAPEVGEWSGEWLLAVVGSGARTAAERSALREAGRHLRLGEVREGVWTRPDNLPRTAAPRDAWETADAQCTWWTARPASDDGAALATRLFSPHDWAQRARKLHGHLVASTKSVSNGDGPAIAAAFVVGAAALAHVRADPMLPVELCEPGWPGGVLRDAYAEYQRAFSDAVREWFRTR